jgi:cell surface protein SprA
VKNINKTLFIIFLLLFVKSTIAQTNPVAKDSVPPLPYSFSDSQNGGLFLNSSDVEVIYDAETGKYIFLEKIGDYYVKRPIYMTAKEYKEYRLKRDMMDYYKSKISAIDGKKKGSDEAKKDLLPKYYINSKFFESIFGSNEIQVNAQGNVLIKLGVLYQKVENPNLSERNRKSPTFDFDQQISASLNAKVGTRVNFNLNWDTQSTFNFQNLIKLEYQPTEDDIIQKIEIGNVSMPLQSSLISGAQNLFGVKTKLQFGATEITTVFAKQQSQTRSVAAQGGATINEFELKASDYDKDRHFFLAQKFRDSYDNALVDQVNPSLGFPLVNSAIDITRIEVWITNRNSQTENVRNIVAIADLAEGNATNINNGSVNPLGGQDPSNNANDLNVHLTAGDPIRTISGVNVSLAGFLQGTDYSFLENARKLTLNTDFTLHPQLGFISLNRALGESEVLAVAYEYTENGQVFSVGELSLDGISAPSNLVVKLLRPEIINTNVPVWDLMMKNVYDLRSFQMEQDGFRLEVLYQDNTTGVPLNTLQNSQTAGIPNKSLLNLLNIDRLDQSNNSELLGDGFFDYVEGITVDSQKGLIFFPEVEPFGEFLDNILDASDDAFVFNELYSLTQSDAQNNFQSKDKYVIKGYYKSNGQNGIPLGAFNVPRGSVVVTTGGRTLVEGVDYVVDYQIGNVQIINPSLISSDAPIQVSVETNNSFSTQNRRFMGFDVQHKFSDDFTIGGTFLNLREKPFTQKAQFGSEPVNNSIVGFNLNYSSEVPKLTKWVNYLPNIDTDVMSNFSIRAEAAYLIPNSPKQIELGGEAASYLDDFEGTQIPLNIDSPRSWKLASTPQNQTAASGLDFTGNPGDVLAFSKRRSKLAWYGIDRLFYGSTLRPSSIDDAELSRAEVRRVSFVELFPEVDLDITQSNVLTTFDLAYYPEERGTNNYDTNNVDAGTGKFTDPENRWGGIMRALTTTDFQQANVEYIQFWMMNPFENYTINEQEGGGVPNPADFDGELYFNLGNISEDILHDGRKMFENGLPEDGNQVAIVGPDQNVESTAFSNIPLTQSLLNAFTEEDNDRLNQDLGLDGLKDIDEAVKFGDGYLTGVGALTGQALANASIDPSSDNYEYFRSSRLDDINASILTRYRNFNKTQGNSPTINNSTESFPTTATTLPDTEDLNSDQTMSASESYFQYKIPINPTTFSSGHRFIVDTKNTSVVLPNGTTQTTTWYQFRIPIQSIDFNDPEQAVGGISSFNSIRFMRIFLTKFKIPVVLRFAKLELVRGDWRRYTKKLEEPTPLPPNDLLTTLDNQNFEVGVVNIQENENRTPINYVLPPGVVRERLQGSTSIQQQNEQSLTVKVTSLNPQESRAVFKNTSFDMRMFKKFKLFVHLESVAGAATVGDGELSAIVRLGSDIVDNYYQIEMPLDVTAFGETDAAEIWKNNVEAVLEEFGKLRLQRFEDGIAPNILYPVGGQQFDGFKLFVKGNPTLSKIKTMMLGIKNTSTSVQTAELWFNEMRVVDFDNEGGWAAVANANANFADFADVAVSGRMSTKGFGSLDQRIGERSQEDVKQYDIVSNINLGQLLPKKYGIQLPLNISLSEEFKDPKYDPQYQDVLFDGTNTTNSPNRNKATDYTKRRSLSLINVRKNRTNNKKKQRLYDVENLSVSFAYNDTEHRDYNVEKFNDQNLRASASYNYSFKPKSFEPFKKMKFLGKSKYLKFIKDFNVNPLPTNISVNSNIIRSFNEQLSRPLIDDPAFPTLPTLERRNYAFDWDYNVAFDLTKSLQFNFRAANSYINDNFDRDINNDVIDGQIFDKFFDIGRPNHYHQKLDATYKIPLKKIPVLDFITATYNYTADFDWQSVSQDNIALIGNTIQNANTHAINGDINMNKLYKKIGVNTLFAKRNKSKKSKKKKRYKKDLDKLKGKNSKSSKDKAKKSIANRGKKRTSSRVRKVNRKKLPFGKKAVLSIVDVLTSVKKIRVSYVENNGTLLPGFIPEVGLFGRDNFSGGLAPTLGFVFGSQRSILDRALNSGWLVSRSNINDPYYNKTYSNTHFDKLDINMDLKPFKDFKIELIANRTFTKNISQQIDIVDGIADPFGNTPVTEVGNFAISHFMLGTTFSDSDQLFQDFLDNRAIIAQRLSASTGLGIAGFSNGDAIPNANTSYTNQRVLLPAFLATYSGRDINKAKLGAFRDIPLPNWRISYKGLSKIKWFKKRFRTVTLEHNYQSAYSIIGFNSNLQYDSNNVSTNLDISNNYVNQTLFQGVNLVEQFSPLIKIDVKMRNSFSARAEIKTDRTLSLNFANSSITEVKGKEYIVGLGYKIKDVKWRIKTGNVKTTFKGDVSFKLDVGLRDNITRIRAIETQTDQITGGQRIFTLKFTADYNLNKSLRASFFYDQNTSRFKISTTFPRSSISTGISLRYNIGN